MIAHSPSPHTYQPPPSACHGLVLSTNCAPFAPLTASPPALPSSRYTWPAPLPCTPPHELPLPSQTPHLCHRTAAKPGRQTYKTETRMGGAREARKQTRQGMADRMVKLKNVEAGMGWEGETHTHVARTFLLRLRFLRGTQWSLLSAKLTKHRQREWDNDVGVTIC